jgi:hypothetical protein
LSNNTLYYAYDYGSSTGELSTTVPVQHTDGSMVKTGDASRALVGMIRTNGSGQFVDSDTQRFVLSYFNRSPKRVYSVLGTNPSTTSAPWVELSTAMRIEMITWANVPMLVKKKSKASASVVGQYAYSAVGHGTTLGTLAGNIAADYGQATVVNYGMNLYAAEPFSRGTDGYIWMTLTGGAGSNTADFPNSYNVIDTEVMG